MPGESLSAEKSCGLFCAHALKSRLHLAQLTHATFCMDRLALGLDSGELSPHLAAATIRRVLLEVAKMAQQAPG